jgi:organic hydroperoxide reductase OsmC/OhrA
MGGAGKPNTHNPEELFGAGYAACYLSALNAVHAQQNKDAKPLSKSTTVDGFVSIGKTDVPVSSPPCLDLWGMGRVVEETIEN